MNAVHETHLKLGDVHSVLHRSDGDSLLATHLRVSPGALIVQISPRIFSSAGSSPSTLGWLPFVCCALLVLLAGCQLSSQSERARSFSGELSADDPVQDDDTHYVIHTLRLPAKSLVEVTLTSPDFDTYLIVRDPNNDTQYDNDDCEVRTPDAGSCLRFQTEKRAKWDIVANSLNAGETGAYQLTVHSTRTRNSSAPSE